MRGTILLAAVAIAVTACQATSPRPAPLAASVAIVQPDQSIPTEYAVFSGLWAGTWGSALDGKLAVQTISADGTVQAIYAWGDHPQGRFSAGSQTIAGKISDGVLRLATFDNGAKVTYQLRDDGALAGTYSLNGEDTIGLFVKR